MYQFEATRLIAERLGRAGIDFDVVSNTSGPEYVTVKISLSGFSGYVYFIVSDTGEIAIRLSVLDFPVPSQKNARLLQVCNAINDNYSFVKLSLDAYGRFNAEYNFWYLGSGEIGEIAFRSMRKMLMTIEMEYPLFEKALHTEEPLTEDDGVFDPGSIAYSNAAFENADIYEVGILDYGYRDGYQAAKAVAKATGMSAYNAFFCVTTLKLLKFTDLEEAKKAARSLVQIGVHIYAHNFSWYM